MIEIQENKFLAWQQRFYDAVMRLPSMVTLLVETPDPGATPYEVLNKTAALTQVPTKVNALWKRDLTPYQRTKAGLSEDCIGALYIPPRELVEKLGTFQVDWHKVLVQLEDLKYGEVFVIDKVKYNAPLFNTCICVELHMKSQVTA